MPTTAEYSTSKLMKTWMRELPAMTTQMTSQLVPNITETTDIKFLKLYGCLNCTKTLQEVIKIWYENPRISRIKVN